MLSSRYPHKLRSIRARLSCVDGGLSGSDSSDLDVPMFRGNALGGFERVRDLDARDIAERRAPNLTQMAEAIQEASGDPVRERVPVIRHFVPLGPELPPALQRWLERRERERAVEYDHLALQVALAASIDTTPSSDRAFDALTGQDAWDDDDDSVRSIVGGGGAPWPQENPDAPISVSALVPDPLRKLVFAETPKGDKLAHVRRALAECYSAKHLSMMAVPPAYMFPGGVIRLEPGQRIGNAFKRTWAKPVIRAVSDRNAGMYQTHAGMGGRGFGVRGEVRRETEAKRKRHRPYASWFILPSDDGTTLEVPFLVYVALAAGWVSAAMVLLAQFAPHP